MFTVLVDAVCILNLSLRSCQIASEVAKGFTAYSPSITLALHLHMTTVLSAVDSEVGIVSYSFYFSIVTFTLHLQREPLYYVVNLIVPCCLLSFIAVSTFLLQASSSERLGLGEKMPHYYMNGIGCVGCGIG